MRPTSDSSIKVVIGCDCDPDREDYGGTRYDSYNRALVWDGLRTTLDTILTINSKIREDTGIPVRFTLNIRADEQVEASHGEPAWVLRTFHEALQTSEEDGHEVAWHPHLWRWNESMACWIQEQDDRNWIWDRLHTWYKAFEEGWGQAPQSVHGGWMFQNDISMQALDDLGITVEYSAIPGIQIPGRETRDGSRFCGACDWSDSPARAYYPTRHDYRIGPGQQDSSISYGILELPTFTWDSFLIRLLRGVSNMIRLRGQHRWRTLIDDSFGKVFINAASSPVLFRGAFRAFLHRYKSFPIFVTYFHSDELLSEQCTSYRRYLYNDQHLLSNIQFMIKAARRAGLTLEFIRAQDAVKYVGLKRTSVNQR